MSSSLTTARMWGRVAYPHPGKWLGTGNRCGHDPESPNWDGFVIPDTKKNTPGTQNKLMKGAHDYFFFPEKLPTLRNLNGNQNKDGSSRQNRSDGRHPETLILVAILSFTEYASLRVGTPLPNGSFTHRSCGEIAQRAGMIEPGRDESYPYPNKRFWRAWRRLKLAGAFNVHQQYEEIEPGKKRARSAIKNLNLDFLISLGRVGYEEMARFRDWCSRKIQQVRDIYDNKNTEAADAVEATRSVQLEVEGIHAKPLSSPYNPTKSVVDVNKGNQGREHYNRQRLAYQKELLKASPTLGFAQITKRVDRLYPLGNEWQKAAPD